MDVISVTPNHQQAQTKQLQGESASPSKEQDKVIEHKNLFAHTCPVPATLVPMKVSASLGVFVSLRHDYLCLLICLSNLGGGGFHWDFTCLTDPRRVVSLFGFLPYVRTV